MKHQDPELEQLINSWCELTPIERKSLRLHSRWFTLCRAFEDRFIFERHLHLSEAYAMGERHWFSMEPAQKKNTARVHLVSTISASFVVLSSIALSQINWAYLLFIPAFVVYLMFNLDLREIRLQAQTL
jgi:hypothetical protein